MEFGLTKNQIISQLAKSPHRELGQYLPVGKIAASSEAEFFGHLVAWNAARGQIRDSKVALPVIALTAKPDPILVDNAMAHIAKLGPREFNRAVLWARAIKASANRPIHNLVERYLRAKEGRNFDRVAMQHRGTLKSLYAYFRVKPTQRADDILFKGKHIGVFGDIAQLKNMSANDAATTIVKRKIPFLVAVGALGDKLKDPDVVLALINVMTPQEVLVNSKRLEKYGLQKIPSLRAAYAAKIEQAKPSLKAEKAAEIVQDEALKEKLKGAQQRQLEKISVEGDWLVLGDKSGSMNRAIDSARKIAAKLAAVAKGKVHLIFFDAGPRYLDVTGMPYDKILEKTRLVTASGGTSVGCGLDYCMKNNIEVDGIAIVSDGGDNTRPLFAEAYPAFCQKLGKDIPAYHYYVPGGSHNVLRGVELFDCTGLDDYSLLNLVATMRTNKYSLVDEIMEFPLLTLNDVFGGKHVDVAEAA